MPYNNVTSLGAHYPEGAMHMHPRAPGYPPQFVGGHQQMSVDEDEEGVKGTTATKVDPAADAGGSNDNEEEGVKT
jgi:hypothetical protein